MQLHLMHRVKNRLTMEKVESLPSPGGLGRDLVGELEGWRIGEVENWRGGELEWWRIGGVEGWPVLLRRGFRLRSSSFAGALEDAPS